MKKQLRRGSEPDPGVPAYIINERDWNYFESFAMRGGWREALRRVAAAWRQHAVGLVLVNILWGLSLFSIIGVPPVTAMLCFAARRALNREEISYDMTVYSIRRYARQALAWAFPAVLLGLVMYGVLSAVQTQGWPQWAGWLARVLFLVWLVFNLYFWVLWWHTIPEQRGVVEIWRRLLSYWRQYPLVCTAVGLICLGLAAAMIFSGFLFVFLLLLAVPITVALLSTAVIGAYPPRE